MKEAPIEEVPMEVPHLRQNKSESLESENEDQPKFEELKEENEELIHHDQ